MRNLAVLSLAVMSCAVRAPVPQTSARQSPTQEMAHTNGTTKASEPPPATASATPIALETAPSAAPLVTLSAAPSAAPSAALPATAAPDAKADTKAKTPAKARAKAPATEPGEGFAALGLAETGENGGGRGEGICLCGVGSLGQLSKTEQKRAKTPQIRMGVLTTNGIEPAVVIRVVRNANARFLSCYQRGLNANPHLEGRVFAKLSIDQAGAIATNGDGASDVPDAEVVACLRGELGKLRFPARKAGSIATVVFPLELRAPAAP